MLHRRRIAHLPPVTGLTVHVLADLHLHASVDGNPEAPGAVEGDRWFYLSGSKLTDFVAQSNALAPDLVIGVGDFTETAASTSRVQFLNGWNQIESPKVATVGNHDLGGNAATAHPAWVTGFGYDGRPVVAGSRFNHSQVVEGNGVTARVLTLDTNIQDGAPAAIVTGRLSTDAVTWVESELAAATEDIALVAMHHNLVGYLSYFNRDEADALAAVLAASPLPTWTLFGHDHTPATIRYNGGIYPPTVRMFRCSTGVMNRVSAFARFTFSADGRAAVFDRTIQ